MDINKMMARAQKMQAEIDKQEKLFNEEIFSFEKQGIILKVKGSLEIILLEVDEILIDPDDKETLQDLIIITINQAISEISLKKQAIRDKITQSMV